MTQPPARIAGFAPLRRWLRSIGVGVSLTSPGFYREAGLPIRNDAGRPYFLRRDIRRWVEIATKYPYDEWVARWEASAKTEPLYWNPAKLPVPEPRTQSLYVALYEAGGAEVVVRRADGFPYVASSRQIARRWPTEVREYADTVAEFVAQHRTLTTDFGGTIGRIESLVVPRIMRQGEWRHVVGRGSLFGLEDAVRCPILAPGWWPEWRRVRAELDRQYPDAVWTTWTNRADLDRFLFTPVLLRPRGTEAGSEGGSPIA